MNTAIPGALLVLAAAAAGLRGFFRRRRQARELILAFAAALGEMESAVRWQRTPVLAMLEAMETRETCGGWFRRVLDKVEGDVPLQQAWDSVFAEMEDGELSALLRRVTWSGDAQRLEGVLGRAGEEAEALYHGRCQEDSRSGRVTVTAVLCGAGFIIILLL